MGILKRIGIVFVGFGVFFILPAGIIVFNELDFRSEAIETEGKVVNIVSRKDDNDNIEYYPVIEFSTDLGQKITFESNVSSHQPEFPIGGKRKVLYDPKNPSRAELKEYDDLYLIGMIFGGLGFVFALIGMVCIFIHIRRQREIEWLKTNGMMMDADFLCIEMNTKITVNGKNPYIIYGESHHPMENRKIKLKSDNLWIDPTPYIQKGSKLKIWMDPNNYNRYYMDTSFLPGNEK